jgi:hypothetical protein
MEHARFAHDQLADGMGLRDAGQLLIEHTGGGERILALALQRYTHRDEYVAHSRVRDAPDCSTTKSNSSRRIASSGPASAKTPWLNHWGGFGCPAPARRCSSRLPRQFQLGDKCVVWTTLAGTVDPVVQLSLRSKTTHELLSTKLSGSVATSPLGWQGG